VPLQAVPFPPACVASWKARRRVHFQEVMPIGNAAVGQAGDELRRRGDQQHVVETPAARSPPGQQFVEPARHQARAEVQVEHDAVVIGQGTVEVIVGDPAVDADPAAGPWNVTNRRHQQRDGGGGHQRRTQVVGRKRRLFQHEILATKRQLRVLGGEQQALEVARQMPSAQGIGQCRTRQRPAPGQTVPAEHGGPAAVGDQVQAASRIRGDGLMRAAEQGIEDAAAFGADFLWRWLRAVVLFEIGRFERSKAACGSGWA